MALDPDTSVENGTKIQPQLQDVIWEMKSDIEIRDYQQVALEAMLKNKRGIIKAPTGSGKSLMMAMLICALKRTTLIKVPNLTIARQLYGEILDKTSIPEGDIGMFCGGKEDLSLITITTTRMLASRKKKKVNWNEIINLHRKYEWGILIEDEVHRAAAQTHWDTAMAIDSFYRFGFSATPLMREDGQNIRTIGAFGKMIYQVPSEPLIENGWLIRPKIKFIPVSPMPTSRNDMWPQVYNSAIVFNKERNLKILEIANKMANQRRSTLIFVDRIDHGDELIRLATSHAGHEIRFAHGEHPDREYNVADFKNGAFSTLIATTQIIGEGFDFPSLNSAIIADGGKSTIRSLQKLGRGMRNVEGKDDFLVFDFADRSKYTADHARERKVTWQNEGFEIDIIDTPWLS